MSENDELYARLRAQVQSEEGCRDVDNAALARLIQHAIEHKTYQVWGHENRGLYLGTWDVVVIFDAAGDPTFGVFRKGDEEVLMCSKPEGIVYVYL